MWCPPSCSILRDAGVPRISIGVQSFQRKFQGLLGRRPVDLPALREALSQVHFETVSMDFIFALPEQDLEDLEMDLETAFQAGANHVAIYPFIDFTFTSSTVQAMGKGEKGRTASPAGAWTGDTSAALCGPLQRIRTQCIPP